MKKIFGQNFRTLHPKLFTELLFSWRHKSAIQVLYVTPALGLNCYIGLAPDPKMSHKTAGSRQF